MTAAQKDTIYIDVDDEITSIVEKVNKSTSKIVALVLPKRAVVLQSIVNMKLLKRNADEVGKRVVLITSETGLLPLAGAVGVYVAKNLQTKPEIPAAPDTPEADEELLETEEPELDKDAAIGDLADEPDETDDEEDEIFESLTPAAAAAAPAAAKAKAAKAAKAPKAPKAPKDKKNRVPNFEKFRLKVVLGVGGVILLLVLWYLAFFVAPQAKITVQTETSTVNSSINFTASTAATTVNVEESVVPAKEQESQKTQTEKVAASGQKDLGAKASGNVSFSIPCNAIAGAPPTIPAGTGVSTGGLTYITQAAASLTNPSFNGGCKFTGAADVTAQNNGDQYNIEAGKTFGVSGYSSVTGTNANPMAGGVSKVAKVVSQQDVDTAKQKITDNSSDIKTELQKQLEDAGYYALLDTFKTKSETVTASPAVDQEATETSVTAVRTYAMTGVKKDDLNQLILNNVKDETEDRKQQVQNNGLDDAVFRLNESKDKTKLSLTMQVPVVLGPKIDSNQLAASIAGKKKGDVENVVKAIDGVKDVEIKYSPFWVSMTPKNVNKITIVFEEAKD